MLKIKRIIFAVVITISLSACSEYHKVLNKGKVEDKYKMATELYEQGKYNKAIMLFEKVIPLYERKPQMQRIQFMLAQSNYHTKNYDLAAYYFNRFIANYPESSRVEEATYLAAHSYYLASPKYSRDQKDTQKALQAFQNFIDKYPSNERTADANNFYNELTFRLEKKAFEIAKQYYHMEDYTSAIVSFENFMQDNIGTSLKEDALYYKFMASNDLAIKSVFIKKEKRLKDAQSVFEKFKKSFPKSEKLEGLIELNQNLEKELKTIQDQIANIKVTNTNNTNGL
jgi:outer membrane protein assembly factor BamD